MITAKIIDIRSDHVGSGLRHDILAGLKCETEAVKTLPTLLLYDEQGLNLFEQITYLDEYYLTNAEVRVLEENAVDIARQVADGSIIVELGSGNLRKIKILLDALEAAGKNVSYYALDLMQSELERTLAQVPAYKHVQCNGLLGTYDDGLSWLQQPENASRPKAVLTMGSSVGNFPRNDAAAFLSQFVKTLQPQDILLVGLDACQDPPRVYHAYNDVQGITHQFVANGLVHANKLLGYEAFDLKQWEVVGEYDQEGDRHRAFVIPKQDVNIEGVQLLQGERIRIEESYKYRKEQSEELWRASGAFEATSWRHDADYGIHLLKQTSSIMFPTNPEKYAGQPAPSLDDWHQLWTVWDLATRQMIPQDELLSKPIKLRNACIFYLGHIPTFADIKLTEATGDKLTEPTYFTQIFERGIDPDVDDPTQCHSHSEIPDSWPTLDEILTYQERVRARVTDLYSSGKVQEHAWTARAVWLGFEHEVMHLETLLYMLIQSERTNAPAIAPKPDFAKLAAEAQSNEVENEWFDIPSQTIELGIDDPDNDQGPDRHFGWDIEKPARSAKVQAFKAKGRPMTNGEYAKYMIDTGKTEAPASWTVVTNKYTNGTNGTANGQSTLADSVSDKAVRTVYGPIPLHLALSWPVSASYDELLGCAKYMGGRIPTMEETQSIYRYADTMKKREAHKAIGGRIPAVNGHLINNGVQESPPSQPDQNGHSGPPAGIDPHQLFVNLDDANIGFKHWHPVSITQDGNKLAGQGEMGGLWEWTSSTLEKQEGYAPMKFYPAYSADFFDNKHNIVLGGSWATHPRVAGRKSFVNWYQRNYPYVWAGARLVKDL